MLVMCNACGNGKYPNKLWSISKDTVGKNGEKIVIKMAKNGVDGRVYGLHCPRCDKDRIFAYYETQEIKNIRALERRESAVAAATADLVDPDIEKLDREMEKKAARKAKVVEA